MLNILSAVKNIFKFLSYKQMLKFLTLGILVLCPQIGTSCIWQSENRDGESPFWPAQSMEVCFIEPYAIQRDNQPNPLDSIYIQKYQENMLIVKRTLESQINQRTQFYLFGFGLCTSEQIDRTDLSPQIRIDMNEIQGTGANAMSIGPRSLSFGRNILMGSLNFGWPNGDKPDFSSPETLPNMVREFNTSEDMSFTALHEVMHLFGFHHTQSWDQNLEYPEAISAIQIGDSPDLASIMNRQARHFNEQGLAMLSERDIHCLQMVTDRSILNYTSRPETLIERTPVENQTMPTKEQ